jgi:hypothetical protein
MYFDLGLFSMLYIYITLQFYYGFPNNYGHDDDIKWLKGVRFVALDIS